MNLRRWSFLRLIHLIAEKVNLVKLRPWYVSQEFGYPPALPVSPLRPSSPRLHVPRRPRFLDLLGRKRRLPPPSTTPSTTPPKAKRYASISGLTRSAPPPRPPGPSARRTSGHPRGDEGSCRMTRGLSSGSDEAVARAHVPPPRPPRQGGHQEAAQVELLGDGVRDVLADHQVGKGRKATDSQLRQRQPRQAAVKAPYHVELHVVAHPEVGHEQEAGREGQHPRPAL